MDNWKLLPTRRIIEAADADFLLSQCAQTLDEMVKHDIDSLTVSINQYGEELGENLSV